MSTASLPDRETDELLELGARRHPDGRRPWLLVVLVLLLATPIVVLSLRHSSSHRRASAPTAAAVRSTPVRPSPVPVRDPCQGIDGCVTRTAVLPAIAALARRHLSPDVALHVRTFLVIGSGTRPSRLVERDLDAYSRSATVVIRVDHGSAATSPLTPDPPGFGSLLLHRTNLGFDVRLQYLAPETVPPMMTDLIALMRDPKLTST